MSFVAVKDATSSTKNIAVKQVTIGNETVEIQEMVLVDPATRAPLSFATEATQLQMLEALQNLSAPDSALDAATTPGFIYEFSTNATNANASDAVWRISRYEIATEELLWADGNQNYDNARDDLANLTYA